MEFQHRGVGAHLPPGDVHQHGEAGHVITLAADVGAVPEDHLTAFRRPATLPTAVVTKQSEDEGGGSGVCRGGEGGSKGGGYSQDGVVPEDADGLGALLSGDEAELHADGLVQVVA